MTAAQRIMRLLETAPEAMHSHGIAEATGLVHSTCHRTLTELLNHRMVTVVGRVVIENRPGNRRKLWAAAGRADQVTIPRSNPHRVLRVVRPTRAIDDQDRPSDDDAPSSLVRIVGPSPTDGFVCARRGEFVMFAACHNDYVDATAREVETSPCCECAVGAKRREEYAAA